MSNPPNFNAYNHALAQGAVTTQVRQDEVKMVQWPPRTSVRYLVTGALNSCTAIAIISPKAGILAHIAPLPDGTTRIEPGTNPGRAHVTGHLNNLTTLYTNNRDKFDPSETWVIAGIWNNSPAMADGIRLANITLQRLGLQASWRQYPVIARGQPREEGRTAVVVYAHQQGAMPIVYVNNARVN